MKGETDLPRLSFASDDILGLTRNRGFSTVRTVDFDSFVFAIGVELMGVNMCCDVIFVLLESCYR